MEVGEWWDDIIEIDPIIPYKYIVGYLRPFAGNGSEVRFEGLSVFGLIHHLHHRGHGEIEVRNSCLII